MENMMIEAVVRGIDNNGTRPEVVEADGGTGVSCTAAEEKKE